MSAAERGVTHMELLIASSMTVGLVLALGTMDGSRVQREQHLREQAGAAFFREEAALASLLLPNLLMQADRLNIVNPSTIQARRFRPDPSARADAPSQQCAVGSCTTAGQMPLACCFNIAANYQWDQYQLNGNAFERYADAWDSSAQTTRCGNPEVLSRRIVSVNFRYKDSAPAPAGGDPDVLEFAAAPGDINVVEYDLLWRDANGNDRTYGATVSSHTVPYTDLDAGSGGSGDSGHGPDAWDISPPPPICP